MKNILTIFAAFLTLPVIVGSLPNNIQNGQQEDAVPVMANFNWLMNQVNLNAAENGLNASITQLTGLTTPLTVAQGGTGSNSAANARIALGVNDANGVNTSITQATNLQNMTLRNAFINGDDSVNQVNNPTNAATGTAVTVTAGAAVASVIDRWYAACTGQNITAQQVSGTGQFKYAMKLIAGATGPTTTLFGTRLEGKDCYKYINQPMNIQVGTFGDVARTVTWTAYSANALDNFSAKTQIATGTISATNAAAVYHVQFNAGANAGNGICVEFTTGTLTNSTGFQEYYGRQMEQVPTGVAQGTTFEFLKYGIMLGLCQRYLPCFNSLSTAHVFCIGNAATTTLMDIFIQFPVTTRVSITGIGGASVITPSQISQEFNANAVTAASLYIGSNTAMQVRITTSGLTAFQSAGVYFNSASGQLYGTGAELW